MRRALPACALLLLACGGEETAEHSVGAGGAPGSCAPDEWLIEGSCVRAGVPPDGCGAGFVYDGDGGCDPILPAEACRAGLMAVPGESECREIVSCPRGRWGGIPTEPDTEYVDANFAGGSSNGSQAAPWTSIQAGIDAAVAGAIVAVAAGDYSEDLSVQFKPVRIWGECPARVHLIGTGAGAQSGTLFIGAGASGSEVRSIAISGPLAGVLVSGSQNLIIEETWIHDNLIRGINVQDDLGPTSLSVKRSLLEANVDLGIHLSAPDAIIEESVVRDTSPTAQGISGRGINVQDNPATGAHATVVLRQSLLERNHQVGVFVGASVAVIETSVIRDTLDAQGEAGSAIELRESPDLVPSTLTAKQLVIERSAGFGLSIQGSDVTLDSIVVRDTFLDPNGHFGRAIQVQRSPTGVPASAIVRTSLVERSFEGSLAVMGPATASFERCLVRDSASVDGLLGDGLVAVSLDGPASVTFTASRIERSARAAISSFGAHIGIGSVRLVCQAFDLAAEPWGNSPAAYDDLGDVLCGCPEPIESCQAQSHGLEAPPPP